MDKREEKKVKSEKREKGSSGKGVLFGKKKPKVRPQNITTDLQGNIVQNTNKKIKKEKRNILKTMCIHIRKHEKIYGILSLAILFFVLVYLGYILIRNYNLNKRYGKYEKRMDTYGFSLMYNNKNSESSAKVTRLEMVKVILSSVKNITEVESIGFGEQGIFEGDAWSTTAEAFGIIDKGYITKDNYDESVSYWEIIQAYLRARSNLQELPATYTKESSFKNLQSLNDTQKQYINDLVENQIIPDSKKKISLNDYAFKGQMNEITVNSVEKYNVIAPEGETLVLKDESKPSNYNDYAYILYSVDKEVYEYETIKADEKDYVSPGKLYKYRKDYYDQILNRSEYYYNEILNVDYTTITNENFMERVDKFFRYAYDDQYFYDYVKYVKENKIIIEGTAKLQMPIIYLDGIRYRARIELNFEVKSADIDKNLLFGDLLSENEITYKDNKYKIYIDAPMGTSILSNGIRLDLEPINTIVVGGVVRNSHEM